MIDGPVFLNFAHTKNLANIFARKNGLFSRIVSCFPFLCLMIDGPGSALFLTHAFTYEEWRLKRVLFSCGLTSIRGKQVESSAANVTWKPD
jgi:hypothetical protein